MINLIIGNNAIGKTAYLNILIKKYGIDNITTNLRSDTYFQYIKYNEERVQILQTLLSANKIEHNLTYLDIKNPDRVLTLNFLKLVTTICRDRDILILDDPEKDLTYMEKNFLLTFLDNISTTFSEMFISTHYECMLSLDNMSTYTVLKEGETFTLKNVAKEDMYAVID